ncbi:unnamed protein product, partial [Pylaiella littoralis]
MASPAGTPTQQAVEPVVSSTTCCKCPVCTCGPGCTCPGGEGPGCDPCATFMKDAASSVAVAATAPPAGAAAEAAEDVSPPKQVPVVGGNTTCCKCPVCTCGPECTCPKGEGPGCDPCAVFTKDAAAAAAAAEDSSPTKQVPVVGGNTTCCKCSVRTCGPDCACPKGEGPECDPCAVFTKDAAATAAAAAETAEPADGAGSGDDSTRARGLPLQHEAKESALDNVTGARAVGGSSSPTSCRPGNGALNNNNSN